MILPGT